MERRKHVRVDSLNLSYICVDENNVVVNEGMGRTLNVSESGILLETTFLIEVKQSLSLTIALENDLVDIRGDVVYSRAGKDKRFEAGVQFAEMDEESLRTLKKFIGIFREQFSNSITAED